MRAEAHHLEPLKATERSDSLKGNVGRNQPQNCPFYSAYRSLGDESQPRSQQVGIPERPEAALSNFLWQLASGGIMGNDVFSEKIKDTHKC